MEKSETNMEKVMAICIRNLELKIENTTYYQDILIFRV